MKTEIFQTIMATLNERIELCAVNLASVQETSDLEKLTIAKAQKLQLFCKQEEALMTKVCQIDTYHIIGMGNLTPPQMMQFTYALQKYLSYRSVVKTIAGNFNNIMTLPTIPVDASFQLKGFSNVILNTHGGLVVGSEILDAVDLHMIETGLPFTLNDKDIILDLCRFQLFIQVMTKILKTKVSEVTAHSKILCQKECMGIQWTSIQGNTAYGTFKSTDIYSRVHCYYEKTIARKEEA